jgi:hypothetical protein
MVGDDRPTEPPDLARAAEGDPFAALPAGTRIGKYVIGETLGQGGFGITYRAHDSQLDRDVAIKEYLPTAFARRMGGSTVVPRSTQTAEDFLWGRARFLDEAKTLAKLEDAPGIVNVYDFMEANGTAYMVMALVRGETLEARLKRERRLPQPAIELLLYPLLDGLEIVHDAGFLHRDIKPANILIDGSGRPTLIDFGASRLALQGRTQAMTAIYTPGYAAPEQMTPSAKQGPWTDIYALAGTLYHCVSGQTPVSAIERLTGDAMVPAAEVGKGRYGPSLLTAIDAGLTLKATDRPQSIADWRRVLSGVAQDRPADAPTREMDDPTRPMQDELTRRVADRPRRARWTWAMAGLAVIAIAGGGWLVLRTPPETPVEALRRAEAEAQRQTALATRLRREQEAHQRAAEEAARKAEQEAARKAAEEKAAAEEAARRQSEEAERQRAAAEAARRNAEEEAARKAAEERAAADALARRKTEEEAAARAAAEAARRRAEEQARAEAEARRKAEQATAARKAAEDKAAADTAARRKAEEEARAKAEAEAARQRAEAQARAEAEARRKAEQEAAARKAAEEKAAAEEAARRKAEEEARARAEADAARRLEEERRSAEARARVEAAAREKAEADARAAAEAEVKRKAEAEARKADEDKAKADADAKRQAEAAEAALRLGDQDRKRVQVALTALGFDTRGADGAFGPRTRAMIAAWQKKQTAPETGFLTAPQLAALRQQAAPAIARFDEEQKRAEEDKRKAEEEAKRRQDEQRSDRVLDLVVPKAGGAPREQSGSTPAAPPAVAATPSTPSPGGVPDGGWFGAVDCPGFTRGSLQIQLSGGRGSFRNSYLDVSVSIQGDRGTAQVIFFGVGGGRDVPATFSGTLRGRGFFAQGNASSGGGATPCTMTLVAP